MKPTAYIYAENIFEIEFTGCDTGGYKTHCVISYLSIYHCTATHAAGYMKLEEIALLRIIYDLIIVDESSTVLTPVDFVKFRCQWERKLFWVGTFLHIPHMLDPDVTKDFENDGKFESLDILKRSLFPKNI